MPKLDSLDKIVSQYFAAVCSEPFKYKDTVYYPQKLVVSPLLLRGFVCPVGCGGCCPKFSLDYLPTEMRPYSLNARIVELNGKQYEVHSDIQADHKGTRCRNLKLENGRCLIYAHRPFSCDFELIRFIRYVDKFLLTQKLFGRGWAMKTVTGQRGALCSMTTVDQNTVNEVIRKLKRLETWAEYFQIKTCLSEVMSWVKTAPRTRPLIIYPSNPARQFHIDSIPTNDASKHS